MNDKAKLVTVRDQSEGDFAAMCNSLLADGYILQASFCGFVNSDSYDFCDVWMAIFALPDSY